MNKLYVLWQTLLATELATSFVPLPRRALAPTTHTRILYSTVEKQKEDRMTVEDEEVLFGDTTTHAAHPQYREPHRHKDRNGNVQPDRSYPVNPLDHAKDPLINKLTTMRQTVPSCPDLWTELAQHCPDQRALLDEHLCDDRVDVTFAEMQAIVRKSANVFYNLGVRAGQNVAILGDNSARWLQVDHGLQWLGAASAVRGADAPLDELRYIYEHSDSAGVVVLQGPKLLQRLATDARSKGLSNLGLSNEKFGPVKTVMLMHREKKSDNEISKMAESIGVNVKVFSDLLDGTIPLPKDLKPRLQRSDLATIVYTSGTTGRPKGVMLSHGNLLHQTNHRLAPTRSFEESNPVPGEMMLSLLPVWHITERSFELWMAAHGCSVVYSSIRTFKNDLAQHRPQWMVLVPRVLEKVANGVQDKFKSGSIVVKALSSFFTAVGQATCYHRNIASGMVVADEAPGVLEKLASRMLLLGLAPLHFVGSKLVWKKVRDGFGGRVRVIISGGSALAGALESFYETAGLPVCVGYGLTECSPLISFRRSDKNLVAAGAAGKACGDTEFRIVDVDSPGVGSERPSVPTGKIGVVIANGPQVMQGYYKDKEATKQAIDSYGWFDTGDLGRINPATGDLLLTGRAKDTIVLSNGENIEPSPIEDAILGASKMIDQCMLTGQDGRRLLCIAVLVPSELEKAGYIADAAEAKRLQKSHEKVNDPKCSAEELEINAQVLREATLTLRKDQALADALSKELTAATKSFRKWEQVKDVLITMEPFAMANGQLTQSYKVKRPVVLDWYQDELPK